ncbi:maltose alpha-D-glucosyltransferase [Candidatus Laterigemmans baculatus]|uniref:maltose alpha-D-glucosyltransferase n=1 Tax=Candidatus Laterigemmans baculatus TaxID=2770505 RepID=UPI0013DD1B80|nr:maltose alpha-D-glucosyltransferase [Candidatus Laterigemmans baculatus]
MTHDSTDSSKLVDDPLWYKDAIIYQMHVKAFYDSSGDGIGDFRGLIERLDYVRDLGVTAIWLLPFYPSPMRDDGYDIADYRNVAPEYGTRRDFRAFVRAAHDCGIRVITELVINHTSDQHPWFQAARRAPAGSRKRDFYVWSDDDEKFSETRIIFTDTERSNWTWDPVAQQYYWHRFFSHQPDLNHNNPEVVEAVIRVMRQWLDMGVDGVRLDAIPYLCVREGTNNENLPETHAVIKRMREVVDANYKNRLFLAEANQWPEDVRDYFGDNDECHLAYHFPLMPRMYMAVAQEDRHPIVEIMDQTPEIPEACQWAIFLRNHDELTLEMVSDKERDYMYRHYASDPRMRINVGIRRRLAPLLDNDTERIKLMNSLLMSMPGSPIVYYGDEIGMGDNIYLGDRNGVRTPMQWSPDRNAGFSRADPQRLYFPPIMDPVYGYQAVNVEAQQRDAASLLHWMKRLIAVRKAHKAFGRGTQTFLHPGNRKILAYLREYEGESILCVANLARSAQPVELDLGRFRGRVPVEMMGSTPFPPIGELPYLLTLPGHGFFWFLLAEKSEAPAWHSDKLPPRELPVIVIPEGWSTFQVADGSLTSAARRAMTRLEDKLLPTWLPTRRWFAAKGERLDSVRMVERVEWRKWLLTFLKVTLTSGAEQEYFLPLSILWEGEDDDRYSESRGSAISKIRRQARPGLLYDAFADESFARALIEVMAEEASAPLDGGKITGFRTPAFATLGTETTGEVPIRRPLNEGSNSALVIGDQWFLKSYRRMQRGRNPEAELGRFLTEHASFPHIAPLAGGVEYHSEDGSVTTLAILQGYVRNQGDAWGYTLDYLDRFFEYCRTQKPEELDLASEHAAYTSLIRLLGQRTGELHQALTQPGGGPDFDPEPIDRNDLQTWKSQVRELATATLDLLARHVEDLTAEVREEAEGLLGERQAVLERIDALTPEAVDAAKTRFHGDYHLGQVLVAQNDFVIIDFEGEPARTPEQRRAKHTPLKDVAGMLRSFDYAAYAAVAKASADRPDDRPQLAAYAKTWKEATVAAFLEGYREAAQGAASYPSDADHGDALIALFTFEKALYEVQYELNNRPAWVHLPLRGLSALMR